MATRETREGSEYDAFIDQDYPTTSQPETGGECMVFYPTMEEFRDFEAYIHKIEAAGAHLKCGVAKIVPPKEWTPRPLRGQKYDDIQDLFIEGPIMQEVVGERGCYTQYNTTYKKKMKVAEFKKLANNPKYKKPKQFKSFLDCEKYYWKHILYHRPVYGADFHATLYDNKEVDIWNINHLPSILDILKEENIKAPPAKEVKKKEKSKEPKSKDERSLEISGVNNAYMYFGMWKASFAWHTEDMDLYSINYIHFGEPKFWYGISHLHRDKFDRLTEMLFPESKSQCKAFMRHKTHLVSPDLLQKHGIPYGTMVQKEGEIIITFPAGYHAGFNLGYNAAESTNFASDRWIEFGEKAVICQCKNDSVRIYMGPFIKRFRPERWNLYKYWFEEPAPQALKERKKGQKSAKKKSQDDSGDDENGAPAGKTEKVELNTGGLATQDVKFFGDELKKEYEHLWKWKPPNFMAEMCFNGRKALLEPHCSICQYFVPIALTGTMTKDVPLRSRKVVSELAFVRDPWSATVVAAVAERAAAMAGAAGSEGLAQLSLRQCLKEDDLLSCRMCCVTVHASCYGEINQEFRNEDGRKMWMCERCRYADEQRTEIGTIKCAFCPVTAGAMQAIEEPVKSEEEPKPPRRFAHILCTLFNHENARFANEHTKRPILVLSDKDKDKERVAGEEAGGGSQNGDSPVRNGSTYYPDSDDPDTKVAEREEVDEEDLLPEPEPPNECSFCHGDTGTLVKCSHPECTPANTFHVPCGRVTGVNYELRDFPTC